MLEMPEMVHQSRLGMCTKARMVDRLRAWGERGLEVGESRVRRLPDPSTRDRLRGIRLRIRRRRRLDVGGNNLACSYFDLY